MSLKHVRISCPSSLEQDTKQEPHVRRHRNIPHAFWAQEGEFYKTWLLPHVFLLLPVPVGIPLS